MKTLVNKTTKKLFKRTLNNLISDLGRPVEVMKKPVKYECFNCYYDKLTNSSTNTCKWTLIETLQKQQEHADNGGVGLRYKFFSKSRCPICKGKGFLETTRKQKIKCKITWNPTDNDALTFGESGVEGKILVELKTDPKYHKLFSDSVSITVDDLACKLFKPPVLRGLGNEAVLVIIAFTNDTPQDTDDVIKEYT